MQQRSGLRRYARSVGVVAGAGVIASALVVAGAPTASAAGLSDAVVVDHGAAGVADAYNGVVPAPDGGTYNVGYQVVSGTNRAVLVTKSNADGTLDTGFGTGGRAVIDLVSTFHSAITSNPGSKETAKGVAVDRLGRLLVLGEVEGEQGDLTSPEYATSAVDADVFVARLHPNGALDRSYGTNGGWTRLSFGDGVNPAGGPAVPDAAGWDIVLRDNQRAVFSVGLGTDTDEARTGRDAAAVQLKPGGRLDDSFGDGGVATIETPFSDNLRRGLLDDDGSFFTTAYANVGSNNQPFIQKFTPAGEPDTSWGDDGLATVYPGGLGGFAEAYGIKKLADGSYVVSAYGYRGGRTGPAASNSVDALLFALTPTGSLDQAWGDRGMVAYHIGADGNNSGDRHRDHVVLPDGRIVGVGGTSGTTDALLTLTNPDGTPGETRVLDFGGTDDYLWGVTAVGNGYQVIAAGYGGGDAKLVTLDLSPAASTTTLSLAARAVPVGKATSATVGVKVDGAAAAGSVKVEVDGKPFRTVAVGVSGTATIALPGTLAVGTHRITASLAAAPGVAASQASTTLTVGKAASATQVKLAKKKIKKSKRATVTVSVTGAPAGSSARGTVTIFDGAKRLRTVALANGSATVKLPKLSAKKHTIRAVYSGDAALGTSSAKATLKVVK